jgi:acetoin utilization deacetylase AcuC-like enzyme
MRAPHRLMFWHNPGHFGSVARRIQPARHVEHEETKRRLHNLISVSGLADHLKPVPPRPATVAELARCAAACSSCGRASAPPLQLRGAARGGPNMQRLRRQPLCRAARAPPPTPPPPPDTNARRVHDRAYIDSVMAMSEDHTRGIHRVGDESAFAPGGFEIAALSAGAAVTATDEVLGGAAGGRRAARGGGPGNSAAAHTGQPAWAAAGHMREPAAGGRARLLSPPPPRPAPRARAAPQATSPTPTRCAGPQATTPSAPWGWGERRAARAGLLVCRPRRPHTGHMIPHLLPPASLLPPTPSYCLFNNVAVAAAHAMEQYGVERVAIVDFDVRRRGLTGRGLTGGFDLSRLPSPTGFVPHLEHAPLAPRFNYHPPHPSLARCTTATGRSPSSGTTTASCSSACTRTATTPWRQVGGVRGRSGEDFCGLSPASRFRRAARNRSAHHPPTHPLTPRRPAPPPWPPGAISEVGAGAGEGFTINVPLPPGSGSGAYRAAFDRVVAPALEAFRPQLVLVSAGYDASYMDPLGQMMCGSEDYR